MKTVVDKRDEVQTVEEQAELEKNLSLGQKNYASDPSYRDRAKNVVAECLMETAGTHQERNAVWEQMNKVYHLYSLSESARDHGVHLGSPFAGVEEFATKMVATIFNGRELIDGTPMDRETGKQAKAAVALVREQFNTEYKIEATATQFFRDAALYGVGIKKTVPSARVVQTYRRPVKSREVEGGTQYEFDKVEKVRAADTRLVEYPVLAADFRIPLTARSIEDAAWCGDFSYPTEKELRDNVERGHYNAEAVERLLKPNDDGESQTKGAGGATAEKVFAQTRDKGVRSEPDAGPQLAQFARFEWWGEMDLKGNGEVIPVVITMVMASKSSSAIQYDALPSLGEVVRITENPYFHQRKPYVAYRPLPREREFFSMGIAEVLASNSKYEDDLAVVGLMGAMWEMSPPLEIGVDSGVEESELDGFFPGKTYYAEQVGQIGFVAPPARSGTGFQTAEYFSSKAEKNMGLGRPSHAPRTPAAGVMTDAQQTDLRQMAWVASYEQQVLVPLAELTHGFNAQYMTKERKIRTLGMDGVHAEDITTISPTDLAVDVRFEPIVGKQLIQQATQIQGLVNLFDRMASVNMMGLQMGKPEQYDLSKVIQIIMRDGFMVRNMDFLNQHTDPSELPTPQEEHNAFAMGERPVVHKNENHLAHAMAHMTYFQSGQATGWKPEDRQALADHIQETISEVVRKAQQAMPDVQEMFDEMMGKVGMETSRPGIGNAAGGAGFAAPGQAGGSPNFRSPASGMGMQMGQNSGAV